MVVFRHYLTSKPPPKPSKQLWLFYSEEAQRSTIVDTNNTHIYDGLFNYSISYVRSSAANDHDAAFGQRYFKKRMPTLTNYYEKKMSMTKSEKASALWLVNNCWPYVQSLRGELVLNMSAHMSVRVYTVHHKCKEKFRKILLKGNENSISYNSYWFYLAFENSLCRDYITEKFWKIITSDSLTIPIVLGGCSLEDYAIVAPPNSYIDVRNFTSAKQLTDHLRYVTENEQAFNYYQQWRNEYEFIKYAATPDKSRFECFCPM